jgi:hypothetical protein
VIRAISNGIARYPTRTPSRPAGTAQGRSTSGPLELVPKTVAGLEIPGASHPQKGQLAPRDVGYAGGVAQPIRLHDDGRARGLQAPPPRGGNAHGVVLRSGRDTDGDGL